MAARVQQHNIARRQRLQRRQQVLKAHAVGGFIKPGVSTYFEASPFKNGDVVFPGRIADPDMRLRKVTFEEVGPDLQRARTADRLNRGNAILLKRGMLCAKQQRRNRLTVAAQPFHWQIQRGAMRLGVQACFRFRHRLQLRDNAVIVVVQPDTQVDFVASRVFFEAFHQRKNRVAGVGVNFLKHAMYLQVYMGQVLTQ